MRISLSSDASFNSVPGIGRPTLPNAYLLGRLTKLAALEIEVWCDDAPMARGVGANALDGPLHALAHLVGQLERRGQSLAPGEWISTGTLTDAMPVTAGQCWRTRVTGVPLRRLEVRFTE